MNRPRLTRPLAAAAATFLFLGSLASCTNGYKQGPAGTVVDKDTYLVAKVTRYELTTRDKDGTETEFKVDKSDYDACFHGSAYPKCTEVR